MRKFPFPQSGFSLLELSFATLISTIFLGAAMVLLLSGEKFYESSLIDSRSIEQTRSAMELIEKELYLVFLKDIKIKPPEQEKKKQEPKKQEPKKQEKPVEISYYPFLEWDCKKHRPLYSKKKHILRWNQKEKSLWLLGSQGPSLLLSENVVNFEVGKVLTPPAHFYILMEITLPGEEASATKKIKKVFYLQSKAEQQ